MASHSRYAIVKAMLIIRLHTDSAYVFSLVTVTLPGEMSQAKTTLDWPSAQLTHVLMAILAKSADSFVFPSGTAVWFSETIFPMQNLNPCIFLSAKKCRNVSLVLRPWHKWQYFLFSARSSPGFRYPLRIPSLTDNTGAEAGGNKLFSMSSPMNLFLEKADSVMYLLRHGT